jgi:ABC-type methionine transport system ATPase subunit
MIRLNKVSKTYQTDKVETLALKDIDLHENPNSSASWAPAAAARAPCST